MEENEKTAYDEQKDMKFCKECGQKILRKAVVCPHCGCQVEQLSNFDNSTPNIVINNSNQNNNVNNAATNNTAVNDANVVYGIERNKWVAFFLCLFFGFIGAHKFYECKIGLGMLYLFTGGLLGAGWLIDLILIFCKPHKIYYVGRYRRV